MIPSPCMVAAGLPSTWEERNCECNVRGWATLTIEWTDAAESSCDSYVQVNLASLASLNCACHCIDFLFATILFFADTAKAPYFFYVRRPSDFAPPSLKSNFEVSISSATRLQELFFNGPFLNRSKIKSLSQTLKV